VSHLYLTARLLFVYGVHHRPGHAAGISEAPAELADAGELLLLALRDRLPVNAFCREHAQNLLKGQHKIHVAAHALSPCLQLFGIAGAHKNHPALRVNLLYHPGGKDHGRQRHGDVVGEFREHLFHHIAPGRAAGRDHKRVGLRHLVKIVVGLLDHA